MSGVAISFFARGNPKGQPRPRAFAMKLGNGKYSARVFDAGTAEGWKSAVACAARPHRIKEPITGDVGVSINFIFRRPHSHFIGGNPAKGKGLKHTAPTAHTAKPDVDNAAKAVIDALTQLGGFWHDDAQISRLYLWKSYGAFPGAHIEIFSEGGAKT